MRRLSFVLLTMEAIILVFPTLLCAVFLISGAASVWYDVFTAGQVLGALMWTTMLLSLAAAWWLLLTYFFEGQMATREVPAAVWVFAALIAMLALVGFTFASDVPPLEGFSPGILFVPTFVHLSVEVWFTRPDVSPEFTGEG
jgi:hypothetical protein